MTARPAPEAPPQPPRPRPRLQGHWAITADLELAELHEQLREAHEVVEAIRNGTVDSLVIGRPGEEQIYALSSVDRLYRLIVEGMNEGAATISAGGLVLYANPYLCRMVGRPASELVGVAAEALATTECRPALARLLDVGPRESARAELELTVPGATPSPSRCQPVASKWTKPSFDVWSSPT